MKHSYVYYDERWKLLIHIGEAIILAGICCIGFLMADSRFWLAIVPVLMIPLAWLMSSMTKWHGSQHNMLSLRGYCVSYGIRSVNKLTTKEAVVLRLVKVIRLYNAIVLKDAWLLRVYVDADWFFWKENESRNVYMSREEVYIRISTYFADFHKEYKYSGAEFVDLVKAIMYMQYKIYQHHFQQNFNIKEHGQEYHHYDSLSVDTLCDPDNA